MFNHKADKLCWLSPSVEEVHHDHAEVETQADLKELLHDYGLRSGWARGNAGARQAALAAGEEEAEVKQKLRYSIDGVDARQQVHNECIARLLESQRDKDKRKWNMRRAVFGHCLVDVKRCAAGSRRVEGGLEEDGSLLKRLQDHLRLLEETPCESLAHYPALQQGEENDKGSVLLVREHLHAAVDLKILFKAHERKELQLPLYLRLQIVWECAQALRALHRAGLGHGDLNLSSIKLKLLTQQSKLDNYLLDYITGNASPSFYSSPEANGAAAKGKALDFDSVPPADIYAFGIVCFELLLMTRICKLYDGTKESFRKEYRDSAYEPSWKLLQRSEEIGPKSQKRFEELISRCLSTKPQRRPSIEEVCELLDEAILCTIVPDKTQRGVWTLAIETARRDARRIAKGKVVQQQQQPNDLYDSTEFTFEEEPSELDTKESHIFRVQWQHLERALCKIYLDDRYVQNQQDAALDTHYDKTKLCLYVIHHLLAEWDMRDILLLKPTQIEQLLRQWKLGRLFPSENDPFVDRFLRKDVLVKRRLVGSVPLFNWIQFNKWFPSSPSSDASELVANISAFVFHEYFQLIESAVEAKYLLHKSDLPAGTFFVHFSRSFSHRILFHGESHPELSEPFAVSWLEEDKLKKDLGNDTLVKTAYFHMMNGKILFESKPFSSLEEWRDHMRSSGSAPLSHPYKPPNRLEFMKLVWRTYKKRMRAKRESTCSRVGASSGAAGAANKELDAVLEYIHPEVKEMVEDIEDQIAEENPGAAESTNTIPYKAGTILRREKGKWRKMFAKAMDGFLVLYENEAATEPFEVITLEGTSVEAQGPDSIRLSSPLQAFIDWEFTVPDEEATTDENEESRLTELQKWGAVMQFWGCRGFLHTSYSPVREQINCKWYVDGRDAMAAMYHAILGAKHTIFITDWRLTGEVYMMRQAPFEDCHRVDQLLKKKAEQGVKIYILLWRDPALFTENGSREVQKLLCQLHDNIKIIRHPYFKHIPSSSWTHHQKSVVIDYGSRDIVAFVGGIDLTWGRWDTSDHSITDNNRLAQFWPGKDYWNQEEPSFKDPYVDILDRDRDPRMAWHDIHMSVDGEAAIDVAFNFIHRWNHHLLQIPEARQEALPVLEPLRNPFRREVEVDPDVQYRLVNKKRLRPLKEQRKVELDAAAKLMDKQRHNGIARKIRKRWQGRRGQRARRRLAHERLRSRRRRLQNRILRAVLRFLAGVRKVGGLPLRRFRTKAKIEERKEKERIRQNRMEMMDAIIHETHEEDKYKKALRKKREKKISAEKEPTEATMEREKSIEKERNEKGTSLTSSQESNADKLEDELDNFERAEHQHARDSALNEKGKEKTSDAAVGDIKAEDRDEAHSSAFGGSGVNHDDHRGLSHAEEKKLKKQKKKEDKMLKKELKAKEKLDRHHSVERTRSQVSETDTESRNVRNHATADTASVTSEDKRRRLQRMLSRQQTKMKLWEEKEKDKWALLRKKWGAKQVSQNDKAQDLWTNALAKALPTRIHNALHETPPLPYPQTCAEAVKCRCQLIRSIGKWSGGNRLEQSIQEAYVSMIQRAKHFIYIENQYFISTVDNHGPCNQIAAALVARLARAIRNKERFQVTLVIPITPSMASAEDLKTRIITKLQYKTIREGKRSIFATLHRQLGVSEEEIRKYFRVNALRNYGFILGCPVTNQVYVHAKLMIIDDVEAIIGSANINDRSMEGDKDSELAVWVQDTDTVNGTMAGQEFRVGKFVHSLRMNLWREHLGLQEDIKEIELKDERHRAVGSKHQHGPEERSNQEKRAIDKLKQWTSMRFTSAAKMEKAKRKQQQKVKRNDSRSSSRQDSGSERESDNDRTGRRASESESDDDSMTSTAKEKKERRSVDNLHQQNQDEGMAQLSRKERDEQIRVKKQAEKAKEKMRKEAKAAREKEQKLIKKDRKEREKQERKLMKRKGKHSGDEDEDEQRKAERNTAELVEIICDPLSDEAVQLWDHAAEANTRIYEEVFPYIAQNSISTLTDFFARKKAFEEDKKTWDQQKLDAIRERLEQVRGHLVEYPMRYLVAEKMLPNPVSDPVLSVMKQAFW